MRADDSRSCFPPGSLQGVYQRRLYKELMKNYNPLERPVSNDSHSLTVHFSFSLLQIMDVVRTVASVWTVNNPYYYGICVWDQRLDDFIQDQERNA